MIKKYLSRFPHALRGLKQAFLYDFGFRTQVYLGIAISFIVLAFLTPISLLDGFFILTAYVLILITELQNSALESALNKIHPEHSDKIKNSKDFAAASVLVSGVFLLLTLLIVSVSGF